MSTLKLALDLIPEKIQGMITDYRIELEEAWLKISEEAELSVSFSAKFSIEQGKNCCEVNMSFIKEKIKDKAKFTWDDKQATIPFKK